MKKLTAFILVFILVVPIIPFLSPIGLGTTTIWYVSPTGNDKNQGDIQHPFQTLQKAIQASNNGDTIYLREGNYNTISSRQYGILIDRSGTPNSWYTISGYPGERAVLNGKGYILSPNYALLRIGTANTGQSYIRITNLIIENSTRDGIRAAQLGTRTSHHLRIDNVTINNCAYRGFMFWSTNPNKAWCHNITVENCIINNTQTSLSMGEGVTFFGCKDVSFHHNTLTNCPKIMLDLANNTKNCDIHHNTFITTKGSGIKLDASQSTKVSAWDENIRIYNNLFLGTYTAIKIGVEKKGGCKNISFYNNIINTKSSYPGVKLEGVKDYSSQLLENILITHNTIQVTGAGSPLQIELPPTKLRNIFITNNIFQGAGSAAWQVRSSVSNSSDSCFYFSHNMYHHATRPANTAWVNGKYRFESSAILASPEFVNSNLADFHLNITSPALDAANPGYSVRTDYDGRSRPQHTLPDIGAYEYAFTSENEDENQNQKEKKNENETMPFKPPVITDIHITTHYQEIHKNLNISWNIIDNGYQITDTWITIISPDSTAQNYTLTTDSYLNQTYTQTGTYFFTLGVRDEHNNTDISTVYSFEITPRLTTAFVVGFIALDNQINDSLVSVHAKFLVYIQNEPFRIKIISSNEKILLQTQYVGILGPRMMIGLFNAAIL